MKLLFILCFSYIVSIANDTLYYIGVGGSSYKGYSSGSDVSFGITNIQNNGKIELVFNYIEEDNQNIAKEDKFNIHGIDINLKLPLYQKNIFTTYYKFGMGIYTQEYGDNDPMIKDDNKIKKGKNFNTGLGISTYIWNFAEVYLEYTVTYFAEEYFDEFLNGFKYGVLIKF
ncbi:MAG: outer membrane beta-barrel protein [Arcobacteraceae bacterium]|nr:outer membrane beta-barrel protein [Arcobacteraceae bacterium]